MSEALLLYGAPERSAALRHEVPVAIMDPVLFAEVDGRATILTSFLERDRIAQVLPEVALLDVFDLGLKTLLTEDDLPLEEAERSVALRAVAQLGITRARVPGDFPVGLADRLREGGVEVVVDDAAVTMRRRAKSGRELDGVLAAQGAAEAGMAAAAALLRAAEPGPKGRLVLEGVELTAERLRAALRDTCTARGAPAPADIIVASVWQGTGHDPGEGPLPAGLPIQIDLWPCHEASGCWADMTRTFVVGDPTSEHAELIAAQEEIVRAALEEARNGVRPGVTGRALFDSTCDRFEAAGHRTQRTGPDPEDDAAGFQFSLGHGVGLEVHEAPWLGLSGRDPLVEGDVLAVEPGLWDPRIGGVRFEDLLLVTANGCETLTRYPYELSP
ncbi:MAG: M24 family metallopeptidase [Solirubrobacteraceae bacterium]